jgi:hypothetical protein
MQYKDIVPQINIPQINFEQMLNGVIQNAANVQENLNLNKNELFEVDTKGAKENIDKECLNER